MKKKVWDITVKDNPNRVVMGENDEFYTTDTEAYLVFNLQDKDFSPPSAVLTLENRNDGSLKNETVDVVDGLIEWEMPQRYIEHFGNWQGQLVYEDTKDGQPELYTSATFTFVVNAHIGDKKKPSLVEIENWEKFIREGTELIETWEDLEALREENERQRQENEQGRESAESVRVSNEEERIANEQARELAESKRNAELGDMDGLYERIYPTSKNLFNHNQLNYGGRLNRNTGGIIDSDRDCYTEYIPVKENATYTISEQGAPYSAVSYDSEYNRIAGYLIGGTYGDTTINTPINASFLRYSFIPVSGYEQIMLNEGNDILPFEEYQDQGNHEKTVADVLNYLLDKWEEM